MATSATVLVLVNYQFCKYVQTHLNLLGQPTVHYKSLWLDLVLGFLRRMVFLEGSFGTSG